MKKNRERIASLMLRALIYAPAEIIGWALGNRVAYWSPGGQTRSVWRLIFLRGLGQNTPESSFHEGVWLLSTKAVDNFVEEKQNRC